MADLTKHDVNGRKQNRDQHAIFFKKSFVDDNDSPVVLCYFCKDLL